MPEAIQSAGVTSLAEAETLIATALAVRQAAPLAFLERLRACVRAPTLSPRRRSSGTEALAKATAAATAAAANNSSSYSSSSSASTSSSAAAVAATAARRRSDTGLDDSGSSSSTGTTSTAGAAAAAKAPLLLCEACDCVCMGADELLRRLDPTFPHPPLNSTTSSSGSSSSHSSRTMCCTPLIVLDLRPEGEAARSGAGILPKVISTLRTSTRILSRVLSFSAALLKQLLMSCKEA
jgi:hypothetical protein